MFSLLLRASRVIDVVNERVGHAVYWLVLVAVLISSGNATIRYIFDTSSNAWLEVQWYLFSAIFLLCAGYTLLRNEHIRIDILLNMMPKRARTWVDILGAVFFLLPVSVILMLLSWPGFVESFVRHEISGDAGGLLRWPVRLLMPVGFFLLSAQAISEIIKRIAFLRGLIADPGDRQSTHGTPAAGTGQS